MYQKLKRVIVIIVFVVITLTLSKDLKNQPLHVDEHAWIQRGGLFFQSYFIEHNFSVDLWQHNRSSYDQPKLAEYLYGAWTTLTFHTKPLTLFHQTDFNQGYQEIEGSRGWWTIDKWWIKYADLNNPYQIIPQANSKAFQVIVTNRYLSILFAILLLLIIYKIGVMLHGFWLGIIAVVVLSQHQLFYNHARVALADTIQNFFLFLSLYWQLKITTNPISTHTKATHKAIHDQKKHSIITGIISGLAFSAKLNGVMAIIIPISWQFIHFVKEVWLSKKHSYIVHLKNIIIIATISLSIFIILNPYTWPNPLEKIMLLMNYRNIQAVYFQQSSDITIQYITVLESASALIQETLLNSGDYITFLRLPALNLTLFSLGLVVMIHQLYQKNSRITIFLFHLILTFILMAIYLKVGIDRYFLPLIPYITLIQVIGLLSTFIYAHKKIANLWNNNRTATTYANSR